MAGIFIVLQNSQIRIQIEVSRQEVQSRGADTRRLIPKQFLASSYTPPRHLERKKSKLSKGDPFMLHFNTNMVLYNQVQNYAR